MRCWKTKDGDILIEGQAQPMDSNPYYPLIRASGEPIKGTAIFYLLSPEGTIRRIYDGDASSFEDSLYVSGYTVENNELREYYSVYKEHLFGNFPEKPPDCSMSVRLSGLQLLDPATESAATKLDDALAAHKLKQQRVAEEERRGWEARLESFRDALPEFAGESSLEFVWQYEERDILIRRKNGDVVWKDATYPYSGKYLFRELEKILKHRYGERLKSFETDIHDDDILRFDPD